MHLLHKTTGHRAPSLHLAATCHHPHCWVLDSLTATCHIFHHRVWYRALSLCMRVPCAYSTFRHHPHPLGYPCAKFYTCCTLHCWASQQTTTGYSVTYRDYLIYQEPKLIAPE